MKVGRPKAQIPRDKAITIRLTNFEFQKISRVAKQKNLTKTDAILQGIDLLEKNKPQRIANVKELLKKRGIHFDDDDD
ncbi:MAG: hypothetical protein IKZ58_09620 [Selenomonadaceae bacterium]|nr:hypothetical protein [Selenomonadaceae bacterium]MBR5914600.1 hypothetical protein [Selenomonadaceae bacterium]